MAMVAASSRRGRAPGVAAALVLPALLGAAELVDEDFLEQHVATYRFSLGRPRSAQVTPDGREVLFLRSGPRSFERELLALDLRTGRERVVLTAADVLEGAEETLSTAEKARRERMRLVAKGLASYRLSRDGRRILVPLSGRLFVVERATGAVRELPAGEAASLDPRFSPDGRLVGCVRGRDLWVLDVEEGAARRLTAAAAEPDSVSFGASEFVAQEEMGRMEGYWFSPDSRWVAYQRTDTAAMETFHLADPLHPEKAPDTWPYPRAGGTNAEVRLFVAPVTGGAPVEIRWDRKRFEYLAEVVWEEGGPLTLLVQDRAQQVERLLAADPTTGWTRTLLEERDPAWLELHGEVPRWLEDGSGFLWVTERRGHAELELRDAEGALVRVLAGADEHFMSLAGVDERRGRVLIQAAPRATTRQVAAVPLAGGPARTLVDTPGMVFASQGRDEPLARIDIWPRDGGPRSRLLDGDRLLPVGPRSVAEEPPFEARPEWVRVGRRDWNAMLLRPRDFDPRLRYPVFLSVYGGPTHAVVSEASRWYLHDQWLANQGFVVVSIDGRGTPGRGRVWHRAVRGDLISIPLDDQARALRALGARYPELDLERVGVSGWSFGGYFSAMAVMRRPDLFKVAVAGAPVVDWRDYDTHYTERYMGLPAENEAGYDRADVSTWAGKLRRPLLLVHGTGDDNVYFLHTLKLSKALFLAGRPFELLPLAGFTHMVPDAAVKKRLEARVVGFMKQHLGGPRRR